LPLLGASCGFSTSRGGWAHPSAANIRTRLHRRHIDHRRLREPTLPKSHPPPHIQQPPPATTLLFQPSTHPHPQSLPAHGSSQQHSDSACLSVYCSGGVRTEPLPRSMGAVAGPRRLSPCPSRALIFLYKVPPILFSSHLEPQPHIPRPPWTGHSFQVGPYRAEGTKPILRKQFSAPGSLFSTSRNNAKSRVAFPYSLYHSLTFLSLSFFLL
jgi:hypothetical protein